MPFNEGHDRLELGANKLIQHMVILFVCKQHTYMVYYIIHVIKVYMNCSFQVDNSMFLPTIYHI